MLRHYSVMNHILFYYLTKYTIAHKTAHQLKLRQVESREIMQIENNDFVQYVNVTT